MDYIYAPWREEYIHEKRNGCVFCSISQNQDEEAGVLYRDEICFAVMNKYPYTPGHFMVIPHKHTDKLEELTAKEWQHVSSMVRKSVNLVKETFKTEAVNIGMNIGADAGAGIAEHLHYHIVPRWQRDTNFITTIGQTRVYSVDFEKIYKRLLSLSKKHFESDR